MNKKDAESMTGLPCREYPDATQEFMRCQIGTNIPVKVQTSAFRTVSDVVFHLLAFGRNWDEALDMLERSRKK